MGLRQQHTLYRMIEKVAVRLGASSVYGYRHAMGLVWEWGHLACRGDEGGIPNGSADIAGP